MRYFILSLLISSPLFALPHYPAALENQNLHDEISSQSDRMISDKIDWFSAAVDGHVYFRALESDDFYHGFGYWLQARTEFRPSDNFALNVRSIFYSGSISSGYTSPTGNYHLLSFYGKWPRKILGGSLEARFMDLGRQMVGQGLLISQKEVAGFWLRWSWGDHYFRIMGDGTGSFMLEDDVINTELSLFGGIIGGGAIFWNPQADGSGFGGEENNYFYFFSKAKMIGNFGYQFENGVFNRRYAALLALGIDSQSKTFGIDLKAQGRFYGRDFGEKFVGNIQNIYISYDQYDKDYTDASNVFVTDDNVYVYSLKLDLRFFLGEKWEFHTLNEAGIFDFQSQKPEEFYFYRVGLSYYPISGRNESISFFVSNKVLRDSFSRPPNMMSSANEQLFKQRDFVGMEMSFRF